MKYVFLIYTFGLFLCALIRVKNRFGSWRISPFLVFHISWTFPVLITFRLKWSRTAFALRDEMLVFIMAVDFLFLIGELMVGGPHNSLGETSKKYWTWITGKPLIWLSLVSIAGFLLNFLHASIVLGLNPFAVELRQWELGFGWNRISNYCYFLNMLSGPLALLAYFQRRQRKYLLLAVIHEFLLLFHGVRGTVIIGFILILFIYWLNPIRMVPVKRLVIFGIFGGAISVTIFGLVAYLRLPVMVRSKFALLDTLDFILTQMEMYLVPNYANLQLQLVEGPRFGGEYLFKKFLYFASMGLFDFSFPYETVIPLVHPGYTVGTFLRDYTLDFGYVGGVIAFFIASISNTVYVSYSNRPTLSRLFLLASLFTMITMAFWFNEFLRPQLYFLFLVTSVIDWFCPIGGS